MTKNCWLEFSRALREGGQQWETWGRGGCVNDQNAPIFFSLFIYLTFLIDWTFGVQVAPTYPNPGPA